jgi:hypothetical protein
MFGGLKLKLKAAIARRAGAKAGEAAAKGGAGPSDFSWIRNVGKAAQHAIVSAVAVAIASAVVVALGGFDSVEELKALDVPAGAIPVVIFAVASLTNYLKQKFLVKR